MLEKESLRTLLVEELLNRDVEDAEEISDSVVDKLEEDGVFDFDLEE